MDDSNRGSYQRAREQQKEAAEQVKLTEREEFSEESRPDEFLWIVPGQEPTTGRLGHAPFFLVAADEGEERYYSLVENTKWTNRRDESCL